MNDFPTSYQTIEKLIEAIDVKSYAHTRNYFNGAVSRISPYVSRGVISPSQIKESILNRHSFDEAYRFIFELAWREYFQKVWWAKGDAIFNDINNSQTEVIHKQLIKNISEANTGISALDEKIVTLLQSGYMHNHSRMYTASLATNIGKAHWWPCSQWMYYHLLDGDLASNSLSWQWVAGTFSTKKYYFNQDNLNKYSNSNQQKTFLDVPYELLHKLEVPKSLQATTTVALTTPLPETEIPIVNPELPVLIYNSYNIDPLWRKGTKANRILLLEPSHFKRFPVSEKVINFILKLSENIEGVQLFVGEINELVSTGAKKIFSKAHPAFFHYPGDKDKPLWMFPFAKASGSFSSFWKACEKEIKEQQLQAL